MKIINVDHTPFHELQYRSSEPGGKIRKKNLPFIKVQVDCLPNGLSSIVATSDLQGRALEKENRLLGEAVAEELTILYELKEIPKIDIAILAGDFFEYPDCRKLGGTGDVTEVWNAFADKYKYVIGVQGNHDMVIEEKLNKNIFILDGNSITLNKISFGGVSGIIGRTERNQRRTEEDFITSLNKLYQNDLIILHEGPDDPINGQKGNQMIRHFFEQKCRSIVICGHKYWEKPLTAIGGNQVLNVNNKVFLFEAVKHNNSK